MNDDTLDADRLQAFMQRYAADQAATMHLATVVVGDQLGLYRAMADAGPQTAQQLAASTGCQPRLVREWLNAQVASAYAEYEPTTQHYWLDAEQAACLADPTSPTFLPGGALAASSNHKDTDRVCRAFTSDGGIRWDEHHPDLFAGTRRFFAPVYRGHLVDTWIPALDGVHDKLVTGGRAADVGCGQGAALILLAERYPDATFVGVDAHVGSIEVARDAAAAAGVAERVDFEVADAESFAGHGFDLICVFNALHEWGDPLAGVRHIRAALAPDGTFAFTEPCTDDELIPSVRARTFYSVSTLVCTPSALAQGADDALGAQAGESALRRVVEAAGFGHFRRAAQTPSFGLFEARP